MALEPTRRSNRRLMTSEKRQWRVQWTDENCLELIELFKDKPELWDPENPNYTHRLPKVEAWKDISSHFLCRMDEVKLKIQSLRKKLTDEMYREASPTEMYKSDWFAYDSFHFLRNIRNKRRITYTSDCNEISPNRVRSNMNAVNANSIHNGRMLKYFAKQRNQFSSLRKPARRKTTTHTKSSSSDEKNYIQNNAVSAQVHDECSTFAEHVKIKLEKFGLQDRAILMHEVNNLIFEAEMKQYGHRNNFKSQFEGSLNDSDDEFVDPNSIRLE